MSAVTTLIPSSFSLSSDSAIEAILSDIPLFCEGIMGIGVFTFYFITKQVKLLSVFLYGSSFLAFAAATFDLSQVLSRGPQDTAKSSGLIYAREIFLSLSIGMLDLFFWRLVAHCPRGEVSPRTTLSQKSKVVHSASWNRWGLIGLLLKWTSLAAVLAVPLLQILWRLIPGQRRYGSIYVADSTIQTSIMVTFILKFILNIYISPKDTWPTFRSYIVPIFALLIGTGLGIANFVSFAFTETSLGRFLRAVEVYVLILHSLYTTFQDLTLQPSLTSPEKEANLGSGKFDGDNILPVAFSYQEPGAKNKLAVSENPGYRVSNLSWALPRRQSSGQAMQTSNPVSEEKSNFFSSRSVIENRPRTDIALISPTTSSSSHDSEENATIQPSPGIVSLSYYTMEDSSRVPQQGVLRSAAQSKPDERLDGKYPNSGTEPKHLRDQNTTAKYPSPQGSVTSIDDILREQNELDQSIAALRIMSTQGLRGSPDEIRNPFALNSSTDTTSQIAGQSRSTFTRTRTESSSNRSDFSLSNFPDPPMVPETETSTRHLQENIGRFSIVASKNGRQGLAPVEVATPIELSPVQTIAPPLQTGATQYDVTSFIGDLSNNPIGVAMSPDDISSESEPETPDITSSTVGAAIVLRPMILASMTITSPTDLPGLSASTYGPETRASTSTVDPVPALRPLLLGHPGHRNTSISKRPSGTMVPLAQRRTRPGGTIPSTTRRPVISAPRLQKGRNEPAPGAFERPRPPPPRLRLDVS